MIYAHWYVELYARDEMITGPDGGITLMHFADPIGNWICTIYRLTPEDKITITYRWRWYRDNKIHDSADDRESYEIKDPPQSLGETIKIIQGVVRTMSSDENPTNRGDLRMEGIWEQGIDCDEFMNRLVESGTASGRTQGAKHTA